jgi:hypothetical protein
MHQSLAGESKGRRGKNNILVFREREANDGATENCA